MTHKILDILKKDKPYIHLSELHQKGELVLLFPELVKLNETDDGHKNNFLHTLNVLKNVCDFNNNYKMKIVALFHDIGKSDAKRKNNKGEWTFHNHENISGKMTLKILKNWGVTDDILIDYVFKMVSYHGRTKIPRNVTDSAIRRLVKELGQNIFVDLIDFCKLDLTTKHNFKKDRVQSGLNELKSRAFQIIKKDDDAKWRSPLTGYVIMDLLGETKGPIIGQIKKKYDPLLKNGNISLDAVIVEIKKGLY